MTNLHVRLKDGECWTYQPGADRDVAWLAINIGRPHGANVSLYRELVVFSEANSPIEVMAEGDTELVIGSAKKHPHPLVRGNYSVHTSAAERHDYRE